MSALVYVHLGNIIHWFKSSATKKNYPVVSLSLTHYKSRYMFYIENNKFNYVQYIMHDLVDAFKAEECKTYKLSNLSGLL